MNQLLKKIGSLLLLLALCLSLFACARNGDMDNDDWISDGAGRGDNASIAKPAKNEDDGSISQSGTRVDLPTIKP